MIVRRAASSGSRAGELPPDRESPGLDLARRKARFSTPYPLVDTTSLYVIFDSERYLCLTVGNPVPLPDTVNVLPMLGYRSGRMRCYRTRYRCAQQRRRRRVAGSPKPREPPAAVKVVFGPHERPSRAAGNNGRLPNKPRRPALVTGLHEASIVEAKCGGTTGTPPVRTYRATGDDRRFRQCSACWSRSWLLTQASGRR